MPLTAKPKICGIKMKYQLFSLILSFTLSQPLHDTLLPAKMKINFSYQNILLSSW